MKGKFATLLVLVVAAVALGFFAVKSYFDFQVTKLKHEYEKQGGQAVNAGQASVGTAGAIPPPPGVGATPDPSAVVAAPAPAAVVPPIPLGPAPAPIPSATSLADSAEMARIKAELDAMRREKALIDERANKLSGAGASVVDTGAVTPPVGDTGAAGTPGAAAPLTDDEVKVQALRQQVVNASAIGKVHSFYKEFDRVAIEGGSERNIQVGATFAVRRGHEILGYLKIEEVEQGSCLAILTSPNAASATARKPQAGDDVIKWPLF